MKFEIDDALLFGLITSLAQWQLLVKDAATIGNCTEEAARDALLRFRLRGVGTQWPAFSGDAPEGGLTLREHAENNGIEL